MPEIEISRQSGWGAWGGPDRCLYVQLKITNGFKGDIDLRTSSVYSALKTNSHVPVISWREREVRLSDPHIRAGQYNFCTVELPLDLATIRQIENARAGSGKIEVELTLNTRYVFLRPLAMFFKQAAPNSFEESPGPTPSDSFLASPLQHSQNSLRETVDRDTWYGLLNQMGWDEIELVEIPVRRIKRHPQFVQALSCLEEAKTAFRSGDYDGTVTKARKACEAAAAVVAEDEDPKKRKQAFETLLKQAIPAEYDSPKREVLSDLMQALADLRHLGAHGGNLRTQVLRHDAELGLTMAAAVFRYLGEAFSCGERKG